jgi:hypothetical protein
MALTSDRRLPRGFRHFADLGDVIAARATGTVRRIGTDMNVEVNGADEQIIDDSVFVGHAGFLVLITSV